MTSTANHSPDRSSSPSPMTLIITAIVVVGVLVVFFAARSRTSADLTSETGFAEAIGAPLPALTTPDPAIGSPAPNISAENLDGDRVQVGDDGVARIYGFFAHWCPACQAEVPVVAAWLEQDPLPDGVELIAISTAVDPTGPNYPPSEWFEGEEWPTPVLLDSQDDALSQAFGLTAFPFWVAVDANGEVVARLSGSLSEADLNTLVADLS